MEAKDTILSLKTIDNKQSDKLKTIVSKLSDKELKVLAAFLINNLATQAEISFKAGIEEVVEWVEKFLMGGEKKQLIIWQTDIELWNYQLKEWGFKEL